MVSFLRRLASRLPNVRHLEEENERLRAQMLELRSQLSQRLWVPPGHFYSPIVDARDDAVQRAMDVEACPNQALEVFGIDEGTLLGWFNLIAEHYAEQPFPGQPSSECRYYYGNPNFPLADALALLIFMVRLRPRRFIEVGSGYSSCAAIDVNERYLERGVAFTFIDPHPELALELIGSRSGYASCFLGSRLQNVPTEVFAELEDNDILFIDSSHVSKTGSDVLHYLFRVIPSLKPGVIVHIHDIFYPFEYPRAWIEDENRSWNEAYIIRAYLHNDSSIRILYWSDWFYKCRRSLVESRMPLCVTHRGGSLWIQKL
jgi:hypothetical protein